MIKDIKDLFPKQYIVNNYCNEMQTITEYILSIGNSNNSSIEDKISSLFDLIAEIAENSELKEIDGCLIKKNEVVKYIPDEQMVESNYQYVKKFMERSPWVKDANVTFYKDINNKKRTIRDFDESYRDEMIKKVGGEKAFKALYPKAVL